MAAQNQHYVPQFILRQFLSDPVKEQVRVFDKHSERSFPTSITNILSERRFNDFRIEDAMVTYEPAMCRIEEQVLPAYRDVVTQRRLSGDVQQKVALSFFLAFQFLRTKASRQNFAELEEGLRTVIESRGWRMEDVEGWSPLTDDMLKAQHIRLIRDGLARYPLMIASLDFFLAAAAPGRSFYLSDNPVVLHNNRTFGPYGNIGFGVTGIQVYMPLSSDLMLCAYCPTIFQEQREEYRRKDEERDMLAARLAMSGTISAEKIKAAVETDRAVLEKSDIGQIVRGIPLSSSDDNKDFYNSIQTSWATRFLICQDGDFDLAKSFTREFPATREGRKITFR